MNLTMNFIFYSFRHDFVVPTFGVFHRLIPPQATTISNVPQGERLKVYDILQMESIAL